MRRPAKIKKKWKVCAFAVERYDDDDDCFLARGRGGSLFMGRELWLGECPCCKRSTVAAVFFFVEEWNTLRILH